MSNIRTSGALTPPLFSAVITDLIFNPAVVGVPKINPVLAFMLSPAGRFVAVNLVGEFVAVIL